MSSIQDKTKNINKGFLLRKASFQKIKCSAYQLGSAISKDSSFFHLLVNTINSSRALVEKPMSVLVIPAVHFLCVAMAFCVDLIRKLTGGVSCEQLDQFIAEVNQLNSKHHSYSVRKEIENRKRTESEKKTSTEDDESRTAQDDCSNEETFHDCCKNNNEGGWKIESSFDNNLLRIASFAGVFFVYLQFSLLVCLLGYTQMKLGFIFLLLCIFTISSFILKISLLKNSSGEKRVSRRQQKSNGREKIAMNSARSLFAQFRSRSKNCLRKAKLL